MFDIYSLADAEKKMVDNAYNDYGEYFSHAHKLVSFTWNFISEVKQGAWVYIALLSQVQKSLYLALLSAIRYHDAQTHFNLRYALESAVLSCYGLFDTDSKNFVKCDDQGCFIMENGQDVMKKAYKWIEENYKLYSDKTKFMKDKINEYSMHANLALSPSNFNITESNGINISFFDNQFEHIIKQRLWWIANISFGLLDLFATIIRDYPIVKLVSNFDLEMRTYGIKNHQIELELKNDPRFSKWIK